MSNNHPPDDRVVVTIRVRPETRARLRLLAAYMEATQADLVEKWASEQSRTLGLPDPRVT